MSEPVGPLTSSEMRQHASNGQLTLDCYVRQGIDGRWVSAGKVKGLFDLALKHTVLARKITLLAPEPQSRTPPVNQAELASLPRPQIYALSGIGLAAVTGAVIWAVSGTGGQSSNLGNSNLAPSQRDNESAGAIRAVIDSLAGKSVKAENYGTTKDEIFVMFKAKVAMIGREVRQNQTESGLATAKNDSLQLLQAMERVDSNRTDTLEFRSFCKELGFLD